MTKGSRSSSILDADRMAILIMANYHQSKYNQSSQQHACLQTIQACLTRFPHHCIVVVDYDYQHRCTSDSGSNSNDSPPPTKQQGPSPKTRVVEDWLHTYRNVQYIYQHTDDKFVALLKTCASLPAAYTHILFVDTIVATAFPIDLFDNVMMEETTTTTTATTTDEEDYIPCRKFMRCGGTTKSLSSSSSSSTRTTKTTASSLLSATSCSFTDSDESSGSSNNNGDWSSGHKSVSSSSSSQQESFYWKAIPALDFCPPRRSHGNKATTAARPKQGRASPWHRSLYIWDRSALLACYYYSHVVEYQDKKMQTQQHSSSYYHTTTTRTPSQPTQICI